MAKKLIWIFVALLLSACFTLKDSTIEPKILPTQTTTISSCPICPTCPAPITTTDPATPTPTSTTIITPTITSTATYTPIPPTPTSIIVTPATITPTPTKTSSPTSFPYVYKLQPTTPMFSQNFTHPDLECNWMGVAGQVFDKSGKPVTGLVVIVKGQLTTGSINQVALTEHPEGKSYGPGGFEITLGTKPVDSNNALTIQLFDLSANPLSMPVAFSTSALCTQNLTIINFIPTVQ